MRADTGSYVVHPVPASPYVALVTPFQHTPHISNDALVVGGNDFSYALEAGVVDVALDLVTLPLNQNHMRWLKVTVHNVGVDPAEGTLQVQIDPAFTIDSAEPADGTIQGNSVTWELESLGLLETRQYRIWFVIPMSAELGSTATFTANMQTTVPDVQPINNEVVEQGVVIGPYDPNDKLVQPSTLSLEEGLAGAPLTYTIRFQNTGTAPAERVVITDTLSASLDPMSMHFMSSSHPCTWTIRNGVLVFVFENIMLPDSGADQLGSQGFVRFRMRTTGGQQENAVVSNTANIYFDLNAAVITAPAVCVVQDDANAIAGADMARLHISPNPTTGVIRLLVDGDWGSDVLLTATDATGRQVHHRRLNKGLQEVDLGSLASGPLNIQLSDGLRRESGRVLIWNP